MHRAEESYVPVRTWIIVLWFAGLLVAIIAGFSVGNSISVTPNGPLFNPFPIAQAPEDRGPFGGSTAPTLIPEVVPTPASSPEVIPVVSSAPKDDKVSLPIPVSVTEPSKTVRTHIPPAVVVETPIVHVEAPVIEEPVVEEPVLQPPVVEEPVLQPPVVEEPVVQPPVVEEPVVLDPCFREDPECYDEVVIDEPFVETPILDEIDIPVTEDQE